MVAQDPRHTCHNSFIAFKMEHVLITAFKILMIAELKSKATLTFEKIHLR